MPSIVNNPKGVTKNPSCLALHSGARFSGWQKSGRNAYAVDVELQHVDLSLSYLCGYLHIKGLTDDWPDLCTFFEGEVIGPKHSFLTRKWDADEKIDFEHWVRFTAFKGLEHTYNSDDFFFDFEKSDVVFMRWKEHFLVPDHRIERIAGASYDGFYYVAFDKRTGDVAGFYYHHNSEKFQQLSLKHIPDKVFPAYDFR